MTENAYKPDAVNPAIALWLTMHQRSPGKPGGSQASTKEIIGAAFEVYRVLGYGFLEKVEFKRMAFTEIFA